MNDEPKKDEDVIPTDEHGEPRRGLGSEERPRLGEDDLDIVSEEGDPKQQIAKLKEKLRIAIEEKQKYLDGWQRDKAEFVNARKRDEQARQEFLKFAKEDVISEILPVLQSFEMAMADKDAWEKVDKNWRVGVEYIHSQLQQILEVHGLKEVNPLGQPFDPMRDEAIEYIPVEKEEDSHKVVAVIQKGYELYGKAIRAPKVKVGEFKV